ncbi:hypothetical protein Ancab_006659 [Ancistrocladus abbreviatus]
MSPKASRFFLCCLLVIAGFSAVHLAFAVPPLPATRVCTHIPDTDPFNRSHFPQDFIFGVGSSAYQYEGAYNVDGKGPSIWDIFIHENPELFLNESGDIAENFYYLYESDIKFLKNMGMDAFRFSISWSRVLPNIQPFVTLFHWDLPQALQDDYRGFLSPMIVKDFRDYADFCFKTFGNKVKYWTTLNEPNLYARFGYDDGTFAPGRCSKFVRDCQYGDSGLEPYVVAHHELLCHAAAVDVYRKNYQASQKGVIGITLVTFWNIAIDWTHPNRRAAARANDFTTMTGFYVYPEGLKDVLTHINTKYQSPPIIITENGLPDNVSAVPLQEALNDQQRISYHRDHLSCLLESIKDGVNVKGYFAWSFLDNFEFNSAYTIRYGLHYVDRNNKDLPRTTKASAAWFKDFLSSSTEVEPGQDQVKDEL